MARRRLLIFMVLAVAVLALPWGAQATNYANSPIIPKFVDPLPAVPVATPTTPPAGVPTDGDYYELNAIQGIWQFSSSLPTTTKVRGYVQSGHTYKFLGPMIVAQKDRPVRIKYTSMLPPDTFNHPTGGNLFLPVDTDLMGAGMGPVQDPISGMYLKFSQNRTVVHLHGGYTPWISDGTPIQWLAPGGEWLFYNGAYQQVWSTPALTAYAHGPSYANVPDMPNPGSGAATLFYPNQQSARLMFIHDHVFGMTRLHIYAGLVAPYLIHDAAEDALIQAGTIPTGGGAFSLSPLNANNWGVPLIIEDKTFVPANIDVQDPTTTTTTPSGAVLTLPGWTDVAKAWGGSKTGDLWWPHVYEINQSNSFTSGGGANPQGRWDYGPYIWPPATITAVDQGYGNSMGMRLPSTAGDLPDPSIVPESYMDTMVVNGKAYPRFAVEPKAYRFRILNACNDRFLNLQIYYAANSGPFPAPTTAQMGLAPYASNITNLDTLGANADKEVSMVKADATVYALTGAANPYNGITYLSPVQFGNPYQPEADIPTQLFYVYPATTPATSLPPGIIPGEPTVAVPFDGRMGGVPDPRQIGPQMIQIGNEGGLLPAPIVLANNCVDYTYDRKQITFGNVRNYALQIPSPSNAAVTLNYPHPGYNLHLGPAERADVIIDFSNVPPGSTLIVYNDAPAPEPGFDPRNDYYTGDPDYSNATGLGMGGAPSTQPGMGPNIRTIMQIKVIGKPAPNPSLLANLQTALPAYFAANQPAPLVPPGTYGNINIAGGTIFANLPVFNKTIAEDFDPVWGRMNAMLGTEQASTNTQGQQTFGFHFADPPTEVINPYAIFDPANPGPTTGSTINMITWAIPYGTQIWKVTHNGVDSHAIHVHLFNAQLVNRVDWVGMIKPPDPNERGWKETFRMNPLEDTIIALKVVVPTLPFKLPDSVRVPDSTMPVGMTDALFWNSLPLGATVPNFPFTNPFPIPGNANNSVVNNPTNFGWEYLWHCHILGHEENDMMRTVSVQVSPAAPTLLNATNTGNAVSLGWTNNETIQTNFSFTIQRATDAAFTLNVVTLTVSSGATNLATYSTNDTLPANGTYYYRVRSENTSGYSPWSNVASVTW